MTVRSVPAWENRAGEVTITVPEHHTLLEYEIKGGGLSKRSTVVVLRPVGWKDPNRVERNAERRSSGAVASTRNRRSKVARTSPTRPEVLRRGGSQRQRARAVGLPSSLR
jgi:hypothetical protein